MPAPGFEGLYMLVITLGKLQRIHRNASKFSYYPSQPKCLSFRM